MWYIIGGIVLVIIAIVGGGMIWRKNGARFEAGAKTLLDTGWKF